MEREAQLSEFTRRLTERNAGLQTAHLATQERLAASERAVSEASRAAQEATDLLRTLEERSRKERSNAASTIAELEARVSDQIFTFLNECIHLLQKCPHDTSLVFFLLYERIRSLRCCF